MIPSFLSPWWGLLGLLAIPIVLLYVLRQRRPDTPVSSTLLWSKALADMRASTPWQRLRRNLLLLLQLLILAACVFMAMRPVIQSQATQSTVGVIVIDATASMQATDHGGASRFDRAREEVRKLVGTLRPGDRLNIIADGGGVAQSSSGFSKSKSELLSFVNGLKPGDGASDLSESLLLAARSLRAVGQSTASTHQTEALAAGKVYLISDGAGIALPAIFREIPLQFIRIGDSADNIGIVRLAVASVPKTPNTYQVFVGLRNASEKERTVSVGLAIGQPESFATAQKAVLPPKGQGGVTFEKVAAPPGKFWVQLDGRDDDLKVDNTGYGLFQVPRKVSVILVTPGNRVLENYLRTAARVGELEGRILDLKAYKATDKADLVIFDGVVPKDLPQADMLFIRPPKSVAGFKLVGAVKAPGILSRRQGPLTEAVSFEGVRITEAAQLERDPETVEVVLSTTSPLLAYRDAGASRRYVLTFSPTADSNWWQFPSLLIWLSNVVDQTRTRHFIGAPQIIAAGTPAHLFDVTADSTVTLPDGSQRPLAKYIKDSAAEFPETDQVGFYTVRSGEKTVTFAVNLLSPAESDITPRSLKTAAGGNVEESRSVARVNREIWQWLAVGALVILLLEWIVYHRRIA